MKLDEILQEELRISGEKEIEMDARGVRRIWINDQHLIHLRSSSDDQFFYLYAKVAHLPNPDHRLKVYEELLEADLFGESTGHAVLAIHKESESIVLMKTFEAALTTFEIYTRELQSFINYLVYWKEKVSQLETSEDDVLQLMSKKNQKIVFI